MRLSTIEPRDPARAVAVIHAALEADSVSTESESANVDAVGI